MARQLPVCANRKLTYNIKKGSRVSFLAQIGLAVFGRGVQLISGPVVKRLSSQSQKDMLAEDR